MMGLPTFPGLVTEKESVAQSPIDPPFVAGVAPASLAVPKFGEAMLNV